MVDTQKKKVVVIGAGVGGVATAARLAKAGLQVSVYEKNDFHGGKCSNIVHNGYRFDRGASIMLMTEVFEETFHHLGTCMSSEGIDLLKCEPNCNVWFQDGDCFATSTDIAHMKRQIEKVEGSKGFDRFIAFLQESQSHYEKSVIHVLKKDFPSFLSLLRPAFLPYLFRLHPFHSVWQRAANFFRSHKLRQVFTLGSMYLGMSPFETPGTYTLLQYAELAGGIWYPRGGFHRVVDSLVEIGTRLGVKYHLSQPVKEVAISPDGKAFGVLLDADRFVEADAVVINADLLYAHRALLPSNLPGQAGLDRGKDISCSSISFYWSLSKKVPQLETHNIFVEDSFGQLSPPNLHEAAKIDPSAAPAGKDAVIVLVLVENLGGSDPMNSPSEKNGITKLVAAARKHVIFSIEKRTGSVGFKKLIEHEITNTPLTWQETFNSERGGIFGLDHSFFNILSFRPKIRPDNFDGIYFVGASTHPGAGVPTCLAGASLTAQRVLSDLEVPIPWESRNPKINQVGSQYSTNNLFVQSLGKRLFFTIVLYMAIGIALGTLWAI
ncbi:Phytoene desaturase [Penicillium atrosanguineum]|nr:Phytoene desaturase [Penicillium atrosanguineum]